MRVSLVFFLTLLILRLKLLVSVCRYCGIHSASSVVKCLACSKWFCSARGNTSSSHIINHLVRARHKVNSPFHPSPILPIHSNNTLGSLASPAITPRGDNSRVLQLWYEKCLSFGIHSCKIRYRCRPSLPPAMCRHAFKQGHELGYFSLATTH